MTSPARRFSPRQRLFLPSVSGVRTTFAAAYLDYRKNPGSVWRVGWEIDPWEWIDWRWATDDGRFNGRWDDQRARFRTIYAGNSLLGCYLELLAALRPDTVVVDALEEITDEATNAPAHPTIPAGRLGRSWLDGRMVGEAELAGTFCRVTAAISIAVLRPVFLGMARSLGATDFDAAVLKDSAPRELTRSVASWIFDHPAPSREPVDGIEFRSRHGDDLLMWALFERGAEPVSPRLSNRSSRYVVEDEPDLVRAMEMFGITWD